MCNLKRSSHVTHDLAFFLWLCGGSRQDCMEHRKNHNLYGINWLTTPHIPSQRGQGLAASPSRPVTFWKSWRESQIRIKKRYCRANSSLLLRWTNSREAILLDSSGRGLSKRSMAPLAIQLSARLGSRDQDPGMHPALEPSEPMIVSGSTVACSFAERYH